MKTLERTGRERDLEIETVEEMKREFRLGET